MNSCKCFVPICENTTGVPFPKQEDLRAKWLEALNVKNAAPTDESFVCLDHFLESDLVEEAQDLEISSKLKPDAIPSVNLFASDVYPQTLESQMTENLESAVDENLETQVSEKPNADSDQNEELLNYVANQERFEPTDTGDVPHLSKDPETEITGVPEEDERQNFKDPETEATDIPEEGRQNFKDPATEATDIPEEGRQNLKDPETEAMDIPEEGEGQNFKDPEIEVTDIPDEDEEQNLNEEHMETIDEKDEAALHEEIEVKYTPISENQAVPIESDFVNHGFSSASRISAEDADVIEAPKLSSINQVMEVEESCVFEEYQEVDDSEMTSFTQSNKKVLEITEEPEIQSENVCRLCMGYDEEGMTINDIFEDNLLIKTVVMECLYPLQIRDDDNLPQNVCPQCLKTLKICYDFRLTCLKTNMQLASNKVLKGDKRKLSAVHLQPSKKTRMQGTCRVVGKRNLEGSSQIGIISRGVISVAEDRSQESHPQTIKMAQSPPPLVPIKHSLPDVRHKTDPAFAHDAKYRNVEEQLRRVLEGSLSQDMMQAENIIIEVESDDEEPTHSRNVQKPVKPITRLKLPLKLKDTMPEKKLVTPVNKIALPKGIRVSRYLSEIGTFPCCIVKGLYDTEFCQGDGYLFEYRLCKGSTRSLRCVIPSCPAMGRQKQLPTGRYEDQITVITAHNHEAPSRGELKKQMFYYVMKRKMQNERTLNFRTVYEEVCKLDPEIKSLVPLRNVINEICRHQLTHKLPQITSFNEFYSLIEEDVFQKLHFTLNGKQFYQERFAIQDGTRAVIFANQETIASMSHSKIMYVDASFKIDTQEPFDHQLVTVLVWYEDSYYPVAYAIVNRRGQEIFRKIFQYLHDVLAPSFRPDEIITDYEANLYYALGETYVGSHIGGSCFYYTQNLYKKICALNLSRELETNSFFRNIYHMLLMLPLLPVNTILDGLTNIQSQAVELDLLELTKPLFAHVRTQWMEKVTPELFCVHRLENRINENVIAPFKKLRDFLMLSKGKLQRQPSTIITVVEKVIELEAFLRATYGNNNKKSFARDLSSSQKKNVIRAWLYIENHPKININSFFTKVLGYIKCMENQLWIWGFYRYKGDTADDLINAVNFSIVNTDAQGEAEPATGTEAVAEEAEEAEEVETHYMYADEDSEGNTVVMEAVIDEDGGFVLTENGQRLQVQNRDQIDIVEHHLEDAEVHGGSTSQYENAYLKYVYREES